MLFASKRHLLLSEISHLSFTLLLLILSFQYSNFSITKIMYTLYNMKNFTNLYKHLVVTITITEQYAS